MLGGVPLGGTLGDVEDPPGKRQVGVALHRALALLVLPSLVEGAHGRRGEAASAEEALAIKDASATIGPWAGGELAGHGAIIRFRKREVCK